MKDDFETRVKKTKSVQKSDPINPAGQRTETALMRRERLCFVITKRRSNSWADDLHACESQKELDKVYH